MHTSSRQARLALAVAWLAACARAAAAPLVPDIVITVADPPAFDSTPVPAEQLGRLHAGADTVSNTMRLEGDVGGNSASQVVSGANTIGSGAFSNASGLPVAIQNSGSNVLIQNATIINVHMQ